MIKHRNPLGNGYQKHSRVRKNKRKRAAEIRGFCQLLVAGVGLPLLVEFLAHLIIR